MLDGQNFHVTFANRTRYVMLFLSTVALTLVVSNSLALNFTVICVQKPLETAQSDVIALNFSNYVNKSMLSNGNNTNNREIFTVNQWTILFSATAFGALLGSMLITYLTSKFGFRKIFTAYGFLSAIATLLTPFAVNTSFVLVLLMRIFQGIAVSTSFVAMGAISAEWSPAKSSGMYLAWLSCHLQFAPMFAMPIAGALCPSLGWQSVFYLQGTLTIIIFPLFYCFFRDSPRFQKNVSEKELNKIETGKVRIQSNKKETQNVPYRAIFTDIVAWGVIIASCAGMLGFYLIQLFGPIYLNKVLKLNVKDTGIAAAIPFALSCIVKMLAGPISDYLSCISDKMRVIFFNSLSQFAMAFCYAALTFLPVEYLKTIRLFFTLVIVFSGLTTVGCVKGAHLAARHFSHVIMAWNTMAQSIITLILPFIVSFFASENTPDQWGQIFIGVAIIITFANIFFVLTIDVEPRSWTFNKNKASTLTHHKISNVDIIPQKDSLSNFDKDTVYINHGNPI